MIRPLTSLRFVFALMVFGSHLSQLQGTLLYEAVLAEGYIGVSFFFVLSGFVLCYAKKRTPIRTFYLERLAKIYPAHVLTLLAAAVPLLLVQGSLGEQFVQFIQQLLLVQAFVPGQENYFAFNSVSWSLSAELFFYLLFPLLIRLPRQALGWLLLSSMLLLLALPWWVDESLHHYLFYIAPYVRLSDFMLGIWLCHLYKRHQIRLLPHQVAGLQWLALGLFLLFYAMHPLVPQVYRYGVYYWLPVAILISSFAMRGGYWDRLLSRPWLVRAGTWSFAFYLLHILVLRFLGPFSLVPWLSSIAALLITALAAALLYYGYERPLNRSIRKALLP